MVVPRRCRLLPLVLHCDKPGADPAMEGSVKENGRLPFCIHAVNHPV
jgi:hypothetical protein